MNNEEKNIEDVPSLIQKIYKKEFKKALVQYGGDESRAHQVAWFIVRQQYRKNDRTGVWEKRQDPLD